MQQKAVSIKIILQQMEIFFVSKKKTFERRI